MTRQPKSRSSVRGSESVSDITQVCEREQSVDIKKKVRGKGLDHSIKMDLNFSGNGPVFLSQVVTWWISIRIRLLF